MFCIASDVPVLVLLFSNIHSSDACAVMEFLGYLEDFQSISGMQAGHSVGMSWQHEGTRHYSEEWQRARGEAAVEVAFRGHSEAYVADFRANLGCHGVDAFTQTLGYLTYNDFWVLGTAHVLLFGVVKDFMYMFKGASTVQEDGTKKQEGPFMWETPAIRAEVAARSTSFKLNHAFGRGFKDLTGAGT